MRALRHPGRAGDAPVVLERDVAAPTPRDGEALIRPIRVGICATDVEVARGYLDDARNGDGITLGHEFVGVVEDVASSDARARALVGQRVVGSSIAVCGVCDMCRNGLSTHCRSRTVLGMFGRDGCFADAFTLPVENVHAVPDAIDDDSAVFIDPLAAAIQAARQIHVEGKPYITVLGDGRLGLLVAQVLNQLNASVRVVGRHESKLALCERWGVKHRHIDEVGRHADQDVVVDCTGTPAGLRTAMRLVRPRGVVVLKSTYRMRDDAPIDLAPLVEQEISLVGSRGGSMPEALRMLGSGSIDVVSLISTRTTLDDGEAALERAAQPEQLKVLMDV